MNRITTLEYMVLRDEGRGKSDTFIYTVPKVNKVKAYCKLGKLEDIMEYFKINSIDQLANILEAWEVMNRKKALEQILKLISSGELPKDLYDKYLSNTPIGFMSFEELEKYFDCNKPAEQEIIKKFEELGYRYKPIIIENEVYWAVFFNYETDAVIQIHKKELIFEKYDDSNLLGIPFTIQEHQLINELFKCWGKI